MREATVRWSAEVLDCLYRCNVSYFLQIAHHKHNCRTVTRWQVNFFDCCGWHPPWCLLDENHSVPADSADYLTKVALQCSWHRHVGCWPFFWSLSTFCCSSFLSCFHLSKSLLIWNKLTPFWLLLKVFVYRRAEQHGTFWFGAWLNKFTTRCLKISLILWGLVCFSCSVILVGIQMFPQSWVCCIKL